MTTVLASEHTTVSASNLTLSPFMALFLVLPFSLSVMLIYRWMKKGRPQTMTSLATNHMHEKHQFLELKNGSQLARIGIHLERGNRPYMEDTVSVHTDHNISIFALFDGHGGCQASLFAAKNLPAAIASELEQLPVLVGDNAENELLVEHAISRAFLAIDDCILQAGCPDGSTAIVTVVMDGGRIVVANLGDSRAILANVRRVNERGEQIEAVALSTDHKPNTPSEKKRIEEKGGFVVNSYGTFRVNGLLATSRAFGDPILKPMVTAQPEIMNTSFNRENHRFLVLGSDGLFDVMDNQSVVEFVYNSMLDGVTVAESAQALVREAIARGSMDNVSAIVVLL